MYEIEIICIKNFIYKDIVLPNIIEKKISNYLQEEDKIRTRIAWEIVIDKFKNPIIKYNKYGKPYIEGDVYFNISHHGDYVVVGFSEREIGIDVSGFYKRKINLDSFDNCFTEKEHKYIVNEHIFHKYWSMKEAFIKALGVGLTIDLKLIELDFQTDNCVILYNKEKYIGYYRQCDDYWISVVLL